MLAHWAVLLCSYGFVLALSHPTRPGLKTAQVRSCPESGVLYTKELLRSGGSEQQVCYACACRSPGVTAVCVLRDCWTDAYEEEQTEQKQIAESIFENFTKKDGLMQHMKCVPFVSGYSDCTTENACSGCTSCECDEDAVWTCRQTTTCPLPNTVQGPLHIEYFTTPVEGISEESKIINKRETNLENKMDLIDNNIADTDEPPRVDAEISKNNTIDYLEFKHIEQPLSHDSTKHIPITTSITKVEDSSTDKPKNEVTKKLLDNKIDPTDGILDDKYFNSNSSDFNQNTLNRLESNIFPEFKEIESRKWSDFHNKALNIAKENETAYFGNSSNETTIVTTILPKNDSNNRRFNGNTKLKGHRKYKQQKKLNDKSATRSLKTNRQPKKSKRQHRKNNRSSIVSNLNTSNVDIMKNKTNTQAHNNYKNLMIGLQSRLDSRINGSRMPKQQRMEDFNATSSNIINSETQTGSMKFNKRSKPKTFVEAYSKFTKYILDHSKFYNRHRYATRELSKKAICKFASCNSESMEQSNTGNLEAKILKLRGQMFDILMTIEDVKRAFKEQAITRKQPKRKKIHRMYKEPYKQIWEKLLLHYLNRTQSEKASDILEFKNKFIEKMSSFLSVFQQTINFLSHTLQNDVAEARIERKQRSALPRIFNKSNFGFAPADIHFDPIRTRRREIDKFRKLKMLLHNFNIIHNRFLKKAIDSVDNMEMQNENIRYNDQRTIREDVLDDNTEKVSEDMLKRLKFLSGLIKNNHMGRKKRSTCNDETAMEYLLTLTEVFLKDNQNDSEDALDLLIDVIQSSPPIKQLAHVTSTVRSHNATLQSTEVREKSREFIDDVSSDSSAPTNVGELYRKKLEVTNSNATSANDSPDLEEYYNINHNSKRVTHTIISVPTNQIPTFSEDHRPVKIVKFGNKQPTEIKFTENLENFKEKLLGNRWELDISSSTQGVDSFNDDIQRPLARDSLDNNETFEVPIVSTPLQETRITSENMEFVATTPSDEIRNDFNTEEDETKVKIDNKSEAAKSKNKLIFYSPYYDFDSGEVNINISTTPNFGETLFNLEDANKMNSEHSNTEDDVVTSKSLFKLYDTFYDGGATTADIETTTNEDLRYKDPISRFFNENEVASEAVITAMAESTSVRYETSTNRPVTTYKYRNVGYHYNAQGFLLEPNAEKTELKSLNTTIVLKSKEAEFLNSLDYGETEKPQENDSVIEVREFEEGDSDSF